MKSIVIIGTGIAGYNLAKEFRKQDSETPLNLITADDGRSYYKPMLSSAFTNGKTAETLATASAQQMSEQLNATIHTNTTVTAIDKDTQQIIAAGKSISYSKLVLALGAETIQPPVRGDAAGEILSVNNLDDYAHFRHAVAECTRIAITGINRVRVCQ